MINLMRRTILLVLMTLFLVSCSKPEPINAFVKGSFAQIEKNYQNTPHMIVFWAEDCAYCAKEFSFFNNVLSQTKTVKMITVATDPFLSADTINKLHNDNNLEGVEKWVFSDAAKEKLFFDVSKTWRGELPFIVLVNKDKVVSKHLGMLTEAELLNWVKQQD
jgi:thiol-disulfide isomerase/thioredoxin